MKKLVNNMAMGQSGGGACQQNKSIHPKKHHSHLKTHTHTHTLTKQAKDLLGVELSTIILR